MHSEELELSKTLYGLTGWKDDDDHSRSYGRNDDGSYTLDKSPARHSTPAELEPSFIPYYDTDYLLDKLPRETNIRKRKHDDCYEAWYGRYDKTPDIDGDPIEFIADTPRKALLLLAVELAKKGLI